MRGPQEKADEPERANKGLLKKTVPKGQAPRGRPRKGGKKCAFDRLLRFDDGSIDEIRDLPRKCARIFKCPPHLDDVLQTYDDTYCGRHILVPSKGGAEKYVHIPPKALYSRTCTCRPCTKQLSRCRVSRCRDCKPM